MRNLKSEISYFGCFVSASIKNILNIRDLRKVYLTKKDNDISFMKYMYWITVDEASYNHGKKVHINVREFTEEEIKEFNKNFRDSLLK